MFSNSLHDRRIYILGMCMLLSLPSNQRPNAVITAYKEYMPSLLLVFAGLKRAYAIKAKNENEDGTSTNILYIML